MLAFVSCLVYGQIAEKPLHFDAASIKSYGESGGRVGGSPPLRFTPGMVVSGPGGATVKTIIMEAYHLSGRGYQLSGGPAWLDSDKFELEARAGDSSADESRLRSMLQTLLAERFKFVAHHETRELPVYALAVGKNGPRFRKLKDGEDPPSPPSAELVHRTTVQGFVDSLNTGAGRIFAGLDRPVLDSTGLLGTYFFVLQPWDRDEDFKSVAEAQLELKFEPMKAALDVVVIDRVERPGAN